MVKIKWSDYSIENLKEIYDYIAKDSKFYAKEFTRKIAMRVKILSEYPNSGRVVPENNDPYVREIIFKNYRIIYQFKSEHIEILTVFHGSKLYKKDVEIGEG
ncbi:MAG: type II toxin-antitoxin system RelE/ParE family toxin [Spirochaetes bacterium]|nr:type II toxin-antitoxin system RelE/ParE family toxin [Spirochaetota bacterium]